MSNRTKILAPIAAFAFLLAVQTPSLAEIIKLTGDLTGAEEVPPTTAAGSGSFNGSYDTTTKKLSWTISYLNLTGPVTRADFHGPADIGEQGSIKIGVDGSHSPIEGFATLTERSEKPLDKALLSGKFYVNLHTLAHPNGEIRGQIHTEN